MAVGRVTPNQTVEEYPPGIVIHTDDYEIRFAIDVFYFDFMITRE